jgi:hypothetical protein
VGIEYPDGGVGLPLVPVESQAAKGEVGAVSAPVEVLAAVGQHVGHLPDVVVVVRPPVVAALAGIPILGPVVVCVILAAIVGVVGVAAGAVVLLERILDQSVDANGKDQRHVCVAYAESSLGDGEGLGGEHDAVEGRSAVCLTPGVPEAVAVVGEQAHSPV